MTPSRHPAVFSPQPQELPLSQRGLTALENLRRHDVASHNASLQETLDRAAKLLTDTVGQINDRASEERERRQGRLQRLKRDRQQETEEEKQEFDAFQEKVEVLTKKMDEGVRKVVDDQQFPKNNPHWIQHVIDKSTELQQQRQRSMGVEDEEEEAEDENRLQKLASSQGSSALLHAAQSTAETEWNMQTLTQKYARSNTYADFYKLVWDSKNPGEHPPPLPHPSIWFAAAEGRNPGQSTQRTTQRSASNDQESAETIDAKMQDIYDEDTELQMTSEVRSVKCPVTKRYFEEPVTSILCPHSYEKATIIELIRASEKRIPLSAEQESDLNARFPRGSRGRLPAEASMKSRNAKCVQCPVPGCTIETLTEADLRFDNVLLRMTKRAKEAERREQEEHDGEGPEDLDEDSDDEIPSATQRKKRKKVYAIGSSPLGTEARRRTLIKPERSVSVIPNSQV